MFNSYVCLPEGTPLNKFWLLESLLLGLPLPPEVVWDVPPIWLDWFNEDSWTLVDFLQLKTKVRHYEWQRNGKLKTHPKVGITPMLTWGNRQYRNVRFSRRHPMYLVSWLGQIDGLRNETIISVGWKQKVFKTAKNLLILSPPFFFWRLIAGKTPWKSSINVGTFHCQVRLPDGKSI